MQLTPREKDKLLISMAAEVARKRLSRGVKLNHPEAIALITDFVVEGARDGRSVAEMMEAEMNNIDAVSILTPSGLHAENAIEIAKYRKHVVVEKPMAAAKR